MIQKICVWPDYEWCYFEEIEEFTTSPMAKSDDFKIVEVEFIDEPSHDQLLEIVDHLK